MHKAVDSERPPEGLIEAGPRCPQPECAIAYVTTPAFLTRYGFDTLRDLPDFEKLCEHGIAEKIGTAEQPDVLEGLYTEEYGD